MKLALTNDIHSRVDRAYALWNTIANMPDVVALDAGDLLEGSPFFERFGGQPELEALGSVYDAIAPGNHGFGLLTRSRQDLGAALVCSNVEPLTPYVVIERQGRRVAVLGVMGEEAWSVCPRAERRGFVWHDPLEPLQRWSRALRGEVDHLIVLSHQGLARDQEMARHLEGVDLIAGAHCHSTHRDLSLEDGPLIVQASPYAKDMVIVDLTERRCRWVEPELDQDLLPTMRSLAALSAEVLEASSAIVAHLETDWDRAHFMATLRDWVLGRWPGYGLAIQETCWRGRCPAGDLSLGALQRALPFDTTLVAVRLDRATAHARIEAQPSRDYLHQWPGTGDRWWMTDYMANEVMGLELPTPGWPLRDLVRGAAPCT